MKSIIIAGTLAALSLTTSVQANQDVSGFYLGGGVGKSAIGTDAKGMKSKTDGTTLKVIGGYQFNRIVAIEAQYTKYGSMTPNKAKKSEKWDPETFSIAANLGYTFQNGLRPFAIIGLSSLDLDQSVKIYDDKNAQAIHWGAGLEYTPAAFSDISFRIGYEADSFKLEQKKAKDTNVTIASAYLAATYKF